MTTTTILFRCATTAGLALLSLPLLTAKDKPDTYLALGDSVAFGFDPTEKHFDPKNFRGYPDRVAEELKKVSGKDLLNAACPGQSSESFLIRFTPDIGCEGYKKNYGLHVDYPASQMEFAVAELRANKSIKLVTLSIGANDLSLLQGECEAEFSKPEDFAACVYSRIGGVLERYGQNLGQIQYQLRAAGGYTGRVVLVKYYSPSTSQVFRDAITALNGVMALVGSYDPGVIVADGFAAFDDASSKYGLDACAAGLLVRLSKNNCDIHPSEKGQKVLGDAVIDALGGKKN